ncbi:unnamed protein product [Caenorhabditis angaria]|uniref:DM13 domain-containing protein n=1 Tax=Caenorhabditis angaria TaxID=860376 RepID=A0A9P1J1B6_9PELO|nr:unnamed protein product [Caenorhabditis angaria]
MVSFLFLLLPFVFCDENQLRPAAIIPWSQYQRRLNKAKQLKEDISLMSSADPTMNSFFSGSYEKPEYLPKHLPESVEENGRTNKMRNVIRPQIRGRLPAEPSDFRRKEFLETRLGKYTEEIDPKPTIPPRISMKMRPKQEPAAKIPSVAIPNGVPMYAASWENGQPRYLTDRKPLAHAANTYNAAAAAAPQWSSLTENGINAPIYEKAVDSNIVSSIFSQSQARTGAIQSLPQPIQTQYFEKLLADGASLEQITKLAKNLLGVGGGGENSGGGGGGGGGLIEAMTSALRGGPSRNPPTSSAAHDELTQFTSSASRPQPSMFEKLLNHAATALNDSLKNKQLQDKAVEAIVSKKVEEAPTDELKPTAKLTKDRENSLKLLENMPAEQRKMLEAAIQSGEIDADSPAIKMLVKDDLTEESKKEKENRLIEWIRSNRPSKSAEVVTVSDKLPYYGKYLGSFAETPNLKKKLHPSGSLWAVNDKKIIISKFVFQPGSLLNENVTFWMGPKTASGNILQDIVPSENGFYVKPVPIDMSVFVLEELPAIEARPRENVNSVKMLAGVLPIVANHTRKRRDVEELKRKPIELIMEGGVVKLEPGKNDIQNLKEDMVSAIPAGFRLQQPEDDRLDSNTPLPLDWYAGFQPLMITLPTSKSFSDLNWIALRDHKRNETVASILLPNGPLFQVPKVIQLRPLSPNNMAYNISSGSIQIIDIKTIRINNFSFLSDDNSVWFMVGKDILPNVDGHIVPLFDPISKSFDCQSLKKYHNETVTLRLPGRIDMKDVFWFSVFSTKQLISYSHVYLPYNDMQLEPDLSSIPTPTCKFNKATMF